MKHYKTYGNFNKIELIKVSDGDTIKVNISTHPLIGASIGVRIRGIDSLEIRSVDPLIKMQAFEAYKFLREFLQGKKITLKNVGRDKYFRILATVKADGQDVGHLMIEKGLAKPYDGGTK